MKKSLFGSSIFAASVACVIGAPPSALADCVSDTSGGTFASGVQYIAYGYNPSRSVAGQPPTSPFSVPSQNIQNIAKAFSIAPPAFQAMLCNLDGIYIDPNANGSWGYRDQFATPYTRYVALSYSLFTNSGWAVTPDVYFTARLQTIIQSPDNAFYFGPVSSSNPIPNTDLTILPGITVLAALAHESGHIFWYDANKTASTTYDYHFCNNYFVPYSWKTKAAPDPWIGLGYLDSTKSEHKSDDNVFVKDIENARGNDKKLQDALQKLYDTNNTRWVSALSAFTPDEDFVETFENVILTSPNAMYPLTSQTLYASGTAIGDSFQYKPNVQPKKNCFVGF